MVREYDTGTAFADARRAVAAEIPQEMRAWDLTKTMEALVAAIRQVPGEKKVRSFARNQLKLSGLRYARLHAWIDDPSSMTKDEVMLVLRTIAGLKTGMSHAEADKPKVNRRLISHTITLLNSLTLLFADANVQPEDAYDGDRVQVREALKKVCSRLGISVAFTDPHPQSQPVTRRDLTDAGITLKGGKQ